MWWNSLVEESVAREWLLNVGQRSAYERIAHLLCELYIRSRSWTGERRYLRDAVHSGAGSRLRGGDVRSSFTMRFR